MKLIDIILERTTSPKAVIMAGGAGAGKSYLLNRLNLDSLTQFNPDKYVEDPEHKFHNNLGAASRQVEKDVLAAAQDKTSFIWDTTASGVKFDENLDKVLKSGYDVYMVMVYTHPMLSYISNFSRERNIPAVSVFTTWRNAYKKIGDFNQKLKGNLSIFINDRDGKYAKEIEDFNQAAKKGPKGIKEYLNLYNQEHGIGKSSFFKPVEMTDEEEQAFNQAVKDLDYDRENRSEDKAVKNEFLKTYRKIGAGPGDDKLRAAIKKYRDGKEEKDQKYNDILESIAEMLYSPTFQGLLNHSSIEKIDSNVQRFLA